MRPLVKRNALEVNTLWALVVEIAEAREANITSTLVEEIVSKYDRKDDVVRSKHAKVVEVFLSSNTHFWHTPNWLLIAVRELFGGNIDLDPCSDIVAQQRVQAVRYYTETQDGLRKGNKWFGNIFINPAFGVRLGKSLQGLFLERAIEEYNNNPEVKSIVLLLKASIGYKWMEKVYNYPICFMTKKICFHSLSSESSTNPHGSLIIFLGKEDKMQSFCNIFSKYGYIPGFNMWSYKNMEVTNSTG